MKWYPFTATLLFFAACAAGALLFAGPSTARAEAPLKVLIVDGQNNHDWKSTTPVMKRILEESGVFAVDVATSPAQGADLSGFRPDFASYRVVLMNYNGDAWPQRTRDALVRYMNGGGGMVVVHAADNSFPEWGEFNKMIALGGWGDRDEKWGPYIRWREGKIVRDATPGRAGSHGKQHEYAVVTRDPGHPIMKGLPVQWLHAKDELYDRLRGPAENLTVLATAYSDTSTGGTGENEPMLMTVRYGKGRVFHTAMGHNASSISCVGFITTLLRGAEWAATGAVKRTAPVPKDFPAKDRVSVRKY
jgi:uncharacterized protein